MSNYIAHSENIKGDIQTMKQHSESVAERWVTSHAEVWIEILPRCCATSVEVFRYLKWPL